MAAIEEVSNIPDAEEEWKVRKSNIETIQEFRSRKLEETLNRLSQPDTFAIQPAMGEVVFFEIEFSNPWDQRKKFLIQIDDPDDELKVVTNIKEISYLKEKYNSSTALKRNLFPREDVNEIMVDCNESVYIPFKFQSFSSHSVGSLYPKLRINPTNDKEDGIKQRKINVSLFDIDGDGDSEKQNHELTTFNVSVEPIPFCIDRCFDFHAVQSTKFAGSLPLPPLENIRANHDEHILSVRCSTNDAAFEVDPDSLNITIRCDVGSFPKKKQFYIMIYNDRYCVDINEIWEINLHSNHHQDCHGVLGGIIKSHIHLPSIMDNASNEMVQFYCDQQNGVDLEMTESDHKRVLNVEYAPPDVGKRVMRIHGVDKKDNNVLWSCLLLIHVEMPKINNSFVIHIEGADHEDVVTRKLPYSNRYNQDRHYEVVSNDPSVIRVNNPILEVPAESTMDFVLEVLPKNIAGHSKEVLLFVTERGNLEECLRIEVKKGKVISL